MGCDQITEIVLPDSITFISDLAFSYCSNLKSINIPQNVTMVEQGVFDGCINLTNIDIADGELEQIAVFVTLHISKTNLIGKTESFISANT